MSAGDEVKTLLRWLEAEGAELSAVAVVEEPQEALAGLFVVWLRQSEAVNPTDHTE